MHKEEYIKGLDGVFWYIQPISDNAKAKFDNKTRTSIKRWNIFFLATNLKVRIFKKAAIWNSPRVRFRTFKSSETMFRYFSKVLGDFKMNSTLLDIVRRRFYEFQN